MEYLLIVNTGLSYDIVRSSDGYVLASFPTLRMARTRMEELINDLGL